jgi:hypothetical protein
MAESNKMPEGLTRMPEEYQKTNEGIERLINIISKSDTANKKQVSAMAKEYQAEIRKIIKDQDKKQKEVAFYISEFKKAGASDREIAAYLKKNVELKSGEEQLASSMKKMQENLQGMVQNAEFKNDEDRALAEKQSKTLEKYFKQQEKSKAEKWVSKKLGAAREETGGALKESLVKGLGVGFQTLLGPLRMIVDPILDLGGAKSIDLFGRIMEKSSDAETARNEAVVSRFDELAAIYSDEEGPDSKKKDKKEKDRKNKKDESIEDLLKRLSERTPEEPRQKKVEDTLIPGLLLPGDRSEGASEGTERLLSSIEPSRSDLLKRGGIIGASAVFLADILAAEESPEKAKKKEAGDMNIFGLPGAGGLKGALAKFLPVALGNAVAVAIPLAMAAGAVALQKRDAEDSKKYADRGDYGRAAETFLLGDRERITEDTAGNELARTTGKFALAGGAVAGGVAAGGFIAGGGAAAAAGAATAAGAGTLGAAGAAGLAALGAVVPPALIAAAIAAAAAAVAKGTQEAYELQYDKNAAKIQADLQRLISDEEAPFLKRVGASFKSDWVALTSTLAGGIRGVTEVMDVEAERNLQQQLEILKKESEANNEESARLYEIMSQQTFREMTEKEREKLLRSEGLYGEYLDVVSKTENSFWEKLKNGAKAVVEGAEGAINTAHENYKGTITAEWEKAQLADMDKKLSNKEDVDRLKNTEIYQNTIADTGDPLKAMQQAFLAEQREMAQALGDLDMNGMAVDFFSQLELRFKSFTDVSDEAIRQSTEFDTRRLQLLAEGMTAEEADRKAMEEQRDILNSQMELRLKQTKEYKKAFDDALKEGKSLKDAERQALDKVKGNKDYLKSFGESLNEGLRNLWQSTKDFFGQGWDKLKSGGSAAWEGLKGAAGNVWDFFTGDKAPSDVPAINDGIVYKDGKVVKISDDDNIIATRKEPFVGDKETNHAAAIPVMPSNKEFSDVNIVSVLSQILTVLKEKEFSPTINSGSDGGMNFDGLRTAGTV